MDSGGRSVGGAAHGATAQGFLMDSSRSQTPRLVGLLWMSDQPNAETST